MPAAHAKGGKRWRKRRLVALQQGADHRLVCGGLSHTGHIAPARLTIKGVATFAAASPMSEIPFGGGIGNITGNTRDQLALAMNGYDRSGDAKQGWVVYLP